MHVNCLDISLKSVVVSHYLKKSLQRRLASNPAVSGFVHYQTEPDGFAVWCLSVTWDLAKPPLPKPCMQGVGGGGALTV